MRAGVGRKALWMITPAAIADKLLNTAAAGRAIPGRSSSWVTDVFTAVHRMPAVRQHSRLMREVRRPVSHSVAVVSPGRPWQPPPAPVSCAHEDPNFVHGAGSRLRQQRGASERRTDVPSRYVEVALVTATALIRFVPACCAGAALRDRRVCSERLLLPSTWVGYGRAGGGLGGQGGRG